MEIQNQAFKLSDEFTSFVQTFSKIDLKRCTERKTNRLTKRMNKAIILLKKIQKELKEN